MALAHRDLSAELRKQTAGSLREENAECQKCRIRDQ
jgi:hypothetical protein